MIERIPPRRVCVITGGNGGIGLAMASALASEGHDIVIWGRDPNKNAAAIGQLAGSSGRVSAQVCDVRVKAEVDAAFAAALELHGEVHALFANAAVNGSRMSFVDRSDQEWNDTIATNLFGVVYGFQAAARHMVSRAENGRPFGRLIATSSLASLAGAAFNESYGATKAAVNALVRAIAVELARYEITANAILPGYVETEMAQDIFSNPKFQSRVLPRVPMRRFGKPDDYGEIARYLISDGASYQTGQTFVIDGGYSLF